MMGLKVRGGCSYVLLSISWECLLADLRGSGMSSSASVSVSRGYLGIGRSGGGKCCSSSE
jgi:hypothetical protein